LTLLWTQTVTLRRINIDTTMNSDDDYDIEDSIDQVMQEYISKIIELCKNGIASIPSITHLARKNDALKSR
jgi:hypothetical protein